MPGSNSDVTDGLPNAPSDVSLIGPQVTNEQPTANAPANRNLRYAGLIAAAFLLFLQIVERARGQESLILATTLASLLFTLLFTVFLARGLQSALSLAAVGLISFAAIAPSVIIPLLLRLHPEWSFWSGFVPHFLAYRAALHAIPGMDGLLMVACAVSIGVLISRVVREFKMLLPIAVVLAVVDMYVVFGGGLVTQAANGNDVSRKLMSSLTVKLPTVHPAVGALPMQLELGFADYLFIGLFFACFVKFCAPAKRTFVVLCCTLAGVMMFVAQLNVSVPALVPIAIVVVSMNFKRFQFARDELFAMLYAGIIVAAIVGALVFHSHSTPREPASESRKRTAPISAGLRLPAVPDAERVHRASVPVGPGAAFVAHPRYRA